MDLYGNNCADLLYRANTQYIIFKLSKNREV